MTKLETIDRALLANTTGGGPSLGDRQNPSAPPLKMDTPPSFGQAQSSWGGMDAGMVKQPANPNMDLGGSMPPIGLGGGGGGALDI